ncbi:MAG: nitroreductase family deazaflavin-dependent oxidoreductase [Ilumatobacteraceae bacterium]
MPADLALKAMNTIHRTILAVTGNRVGWRAGGMPVLELTTTGRHTGQRRSVMLTSPVQEDDAWVIVASRGGDDRHPAWFLNLLANPQVTVRLEGGPSRLMTARTATGDERERLWSKVVATYPHYGKYQDKTDRTIPLVVLSD